MTDTPNNQALANLLNHATANELVAVQRERDALRQERDATLLALSALCERHGGEEPHTLEACIAHLTKTLNDLPGLDAYRENT